MQILHSSLHVLGHRGVTRTFAALLWLLQLMATNAYKGSHTHISPKPAELRKQRKAEAAEGLSLPLR